MDGNSGAGKPAQDRRARSRSRTRPGLSSRVNFFEQVWKGRNRSPSVEGLHDDAAAGSTHVSAVWMEQRTEQRVVEWTTLSSSSTVDQKLSSADAADATWWRLRRTPERKTAVAAAAAAAAEDAVIASVPPPSAAFSKYQETRCRRQSSQEAAAAPSTPVQEDVAPWRRKRRAESAAAQESFSSDVQFSVVSARRTTVTSVASLSSTTSTTHGVDWYSQYRSGATQAQSRLEKREANVTSHYDVHIAQIKGSTAERTKLNESRNNHFSHVRRLYYLSFTYC